MLIILNVTKNILYNRWTQNHYYANNIIVYNHVLSSLCSNDLGIKYLIILDAAALPSFIFSVFLILANSDMSAV